jgi:F-type H+-transporting ATPase subunit a
VSGHAVLARTVAEGVPFPPSVEDFYLPSLAYGNWVTKFTIMVWLAAAFLIVYFLVAYRNPKIVPSKGQWFAESIYGFVRDGVAKDLIGHKGVRFAPYLTTLFAFIAVCNMFSVLPFLQISPMSHIAFPFMLGLLSWGIYVYNGMRTHGPLGYVKHVTVTPGVPWAIYPLLVPLEFIQNLIVRPLTLAVRLFANMFAGHLILLVFTLGGFALFATGNIALYAVGAVSFVMAVIMTLFEFGVALLQAYVFVLLSSFYIGEGLAEEH